MSRCRVALLLLAGVAYAGLSHWLMLFHPHAPWAMAVLLGPLWFTAIGLGGSRFGGWGVLGAAVAGVLIFVALWRGGAGGPNRLYVLQHVGMNGVLACWFGGSLRGGRLSLIGQFAQRVHPLQAGMPEYTRQVTWVWTIYFTLTALVSMPVYLWLPFSARSLLANVLSPVMVAVLFVGEHLVRYRLHPEFERTRMIDAVRAFYGASSAEPTARR